MASTEVLAPDGFSAITSLRSVYHIISDRREGRLVLVDSFCIYMLNLCQVIALDHSGHLPPCHPNTCCATLGASLWGRADSGSCVTIREMLLILTVPAEYISN